MKVDGLPPLLQCSDVEPVARNLLVSEPGGRSNRLQPLGGIRDIVIAFNSVYHSFYQLSSVNFANTTAIPTNITQLTASITNSKLISPPFLGHYITVVVDCQGATTCCWCVQHLTKTQNCATVSYERRWL